MVNARENPACYWTTTGLMPRYAKAEFRGVHLYNKGAAYLDRHLWNGSYYEQRVTTFFSCARGFGTITLTEPRAPPYVT